MENIRGESASRKRRRGTDLKLSRDHELDRNIKKEPKKKPKKKRKLKKILCLLMCFIFVIFCVIIGVYNYINYKIYNSIIKSNNEYLNIDYKFGYIILWDKTLKYIENSDKQVAFSNKDCSVIYKKDKIKKCNKLAKISLKCEKIKYEEIKDISGESIEIFDKKDSVNEISFNRDTSIFIYNTVDVYGIDKENKLQLYKKIENIEDKIEFDIPRNENGQAMYDKYVVVYVPVKEISIDKDNFELNKGQSVGLNLKVIPENATSKELSFDGTNDGVIISSENILTANIAGDYEITAKAKNEDILKKFNVKVNEIAQKIDVDKNSVKLYVNGSTKINAKVFPENSYNSEVEYLTSDEKVAVVDNEGNITAKSSGKCDIKIKTKAEPVIEVNIPVTVRNKEQSFDRNNQTSNEGEVTYINGVLVVNKKYGVPSSYNPGVNQTALNAYYSLKADANSVGFSMPLLSGFRSYNTQVGLYNRYVSAYGQATADTFSARPGHSEHQTGLAFDVGSIDNNYGNTAGGKWLANNCYKYGFIIRYPKGKQNITGYQYEPWHIRYLGNPLATEVHNSGLCLEEYLGI